MCFAHLLSIYGRVFFFMYGLWQTLREARYANVRQTLLGCGGGGGVGRRRQSHEGIRRCLFAVDVRDCVFNVTRRSCRAHLGEDIYRARLMRE